MPLQIKYAYLYDKSEVHHIPVTVNNTLLHKTQGQLSFYIWQFIETESIWVNLL